MELTITSESMNVSEATKEMNLPSLSQSTVDTISLNTQTFTHPNLAYQLLAGQGN